MTQTTKCAAAVGMMLVGAILWQAGQERAANVQPMMPESMEFPSPMSAMPQMPPEAFSANAFPAMPVPQMPQMPFPSLDMQGPPMDMSGLIGNQVMLQGLGDQMAMQAGAAYLNGVQDYRRRTGDYTTQFNVVSPDALQRSIRGANDATQAFIGSGAASSAARAQAADIYSTRGVLGLNEVWNPSTGTVQSVDGNMQRYYADRYGVAHGTPGTTIPYGTTPLIPRWQ